MSKFALLQQYEGVGPWFVHELFDANPRLHSGLLVVDVSKYAGIKPGWARRDDGSFGPYVPPLVDAQASKLISLRLSCALTITSGFQSSALGSAYLYGSSNTDQQNLLSDVDAARSADAKWRVDISCSDTDGVWVRRSHSADEVQQVAADFRAWRRAAQAKLAQLAEEVSKAGSVDIVNVIAW